MCQFRLSRGPAIKQGEAKLRLQRVDRVADGGGGPPKTLGSSGEASLLDYGQQHQKLVYTRRSGSLHFEFPEKSFQFYPYFLSAKSSYFPIVGSRFQPTQSRTKHAEVRIVFLHPPAQPFPPLPISTTV